MLQLLRYGTAAVWLVFGLGFKLLGWVPRHRQIVAAILGDEAAGPATVAIGAGEALVGIWILLGVRPRLCAATQTALLAAMNGLELAFARELLLAPAGMVAANAAFLGAVWWWALRAEPRRRSR
jgi:uncharacterized membrane protein YphA (DoxX/SURF4 family)